MKYPDIAVLQDEVKFLEGLGPADGTLKESLHNRLSAVRKELRHRKAQTVRDMWNHDDKSLLRQVHAGRYLTASETEDRDLFTVEYVVRQYQANHNKYVTLQDLAVLAEGVSGPAHTVALAVMQGRLKLGWYQYTGVAHVSTPGFFEPKDTAR